MRTGFRISVTVRESGEYAPRVIKGWMRACTPLEALLEREWFSVYLAESGQVMLLRTCNIVAITATEQTEIIPE